MSVESFSAFILSSFTSLQRSNASKINSLYKISHLPDSKKIPIIDLPFVNPYLPYNKLSHSITKAVRSLISPSKSQIKEYVHALKSLINILHLPLKMSSLLLWIYHPIFQKYGYLRLLLIFILEL